MEEEEESWLTEEVRCDLCSYEWWAVYHIDCDRLECNRCGNMSHFETINTIEDGK